ncbi:hypothetical protein COU60_03335 [Candidatus Pacearchaeota archaeon CG10_big_fil_rev_8_21_14_0_10_34_76]|nr:MAG: hypothetical protein COU60_03335 [Candidatus Pacearchaeota archaeon CG10_big_fil_rev_8_21_14_0_10_34_76]
MENEISEVQETSEAIPETKREIVIPGEIIVSGDDYLPGEGVRREGDNIVASKFGLAEQIGRVVKIISVTGSYVPRRNNVILGRITDVLHNGWLLDIDAASSAFLPVAEVPRYINQHEMSQFLAIGDIVSAKIWSIKGRGIDLAMKGRGLGKVEGGFIFRIQPSRVPRVIGREGSMITLIKEDTGCNITVGQNGWIWIKGESIDQELRARKAIEYIADKVNVGGLTEHMEAWFKDN